jgi:protein disulfide-isomerase A6
LDGSLLPTAGRVASLDDILSAANFQVTSEVVTQLKEAVKGLAGKEAKYGSTYVSVADKVLAKGADYVTKEAARVTKMLAGGNVKPESKSQFQYKLNVLRAFQGAAASTSSDEL